jgi:CTP-dependent riboflavin kinase
MQIPEIFPQLTTKKFIEGRTGEMIYVKDNGESYYQRSNDDPIITILDMKRIVSIGTPVSGFGHN